MDKETTGQETAEVIEPKADETPETPETVETPEAEEQTEVKETPQAEADTKDEPEDNEDSEEKPVEETPEEDDTVVKELDSVKEHLKKEQKKVEDLKSQVKGLESVISTIVDAKIKDIPKEYHMLIPEGSLVSRLDWINKAEASGLFKKQANPEVEIGKPLNLGNKKEKAVANQSPQQKLSNYFSNFYSK